MTSKEKHEAQFEYCKRKNIPHFAPLKCYDCRGDVYAKVSDEEAATTLITGCRHCCYSFVE